VTVIIHADRQKRGGSGLSWHDYLDCGGLRRHRRTYVSVAVRKEERKIILERRAYWRRSIPCGRRGGGMVRVF